MPSCLSLIVLAAPAAIAHGEAAPAAQVSTSEPRLYDCDVEYDTWETAWTPAWKAWCCEDQQRGCPPTTTDTTTSVTTTSVTTVTVTVTTTTNKTLELSQCSAKCEYKGANYTCMQRIQWAAEHETQEAENPCQAAHTKVLHECDICNACDFDFAGCSTEDDEGEDDAVVMKKFTLRQTIQQPTRTERSVATVLPLGLAAGFVGGLSLLGVAYRAFRGRGGMQPAVEFERAFVEVDVEESVGRE